MRCLRSLVEYRGQASFVFNPQSALSRCLFDTILSSLLTHLSDVQFSLLHHRLPRRAANPYTAPLYIRSTYSSTNIPDATRRCASMRLVPIKAHLLVSDFPRSSRLAGPRRCPAANPKWPMDGADCDLTEVSHEAHNPL